MFKCSFKDCDKDAVCGLRKKDNPTYIINVCPKHFKDMKGYPIEEDEYYKKGLIGSQSVMGLI